MRWREFGRMSHMRGAYEITLWQVSSLFGLRKHYEITCDRCVIVRAGAPTSGEAWEMLYGHAHWHARRGAEGAPITEKEQVDG